MIEIQKGDRDKEFQKMRDVFLDEICEPVELYSEVICIKAVPYFFIKDGKRIGYILFGEDNVIHEFFLETEYVPRAPEIFKMVLEELPVEKAICQSWDHLFMSMCLLHFEKKKGVGHIFRDRIEPRKPIPEFDLKERKATLDDIELLTKYRDEIFDDNEVDQIPYWIEKGGCIIYEDDDGNFIGYGMINRTIEGRDSFDIGMYVNPEYRKKGYGTWIINRLANTCIQNGWRPTAGCALKNTYSKKTLERAGFVSKHLIVEFWN
jgi:GNAT superfamily N-acetyltransferase